MTFLTLDVPCFECSDDPVSVMYSGTDLDAAIAAAAQVSKQPYDDIYSRTDRNAEEVLLNERLAGWSVQIIRVP